MGHNAENKLNRLLAGIMAIMVLFVVLFASFFVVSHTHHDCSGEDCPVCATIHQCENLLNGAGGSFLHIAAGVLPVVLVIGSVIISFCAVILGTPVSTKVRMNN
ncbi:AraC family transcriptional regulator [Butyrivibrio sp. CB08]|uniref:AraC family transcriptional regulator n=1 Tax=Butyrivibrio sp. CB08 TaxID=2364879 RepID=UPI000EA868A1|nr:AraC family transcriptional regulator [Butyrivibrio sp. CB08]RKM59206.1 AraC family transcriptional regulator [Butyrivibrio sp. CB08]